MSWKLCDYPIFLKQVWNSAVKIIYFRLKAITKELKVKIHHLQSNQHLSVVTPYDK